MKRSEYLTELKGMALPDLKDRALKLAEELMKLRFRKATNQLDKGHLLRETRRRLAQVQTLVTLKANALQLS